MSDRASSDAAIPDWMFRDPDPSDEAIRLMVDEAIRTDDWSEVYAAGMRRHERRYRPMIAALIGAGWTFELPAASDDLMAWSWRRPPRRKGRPGRKYPSTDQAYNALMREMADETTPAADPP